MPDDIWVIVQESAGSLLECPFCGKSKPVLIAAPTRFGIQCSNKKCLALVYVDYSDKIYIAMHEDRKLSEEEFKAIIKEAALKWNRRPDK